MRNAQDQPQKIKNPANQNKTKNIFYNPKLNPPPLLFVQIRKNKTHHNTIIGVNFQVCTGVDVYSCTRILSFSAWAPVSAVRAAFQDGIRMKPILGGVPSAESFDVVVLAVAASPSAPNPMWRRASPMWCEGLLDLTCRSTPKQAASVFRDRIEPTI